MRLSLDLVSWRAIPECARERERLSMGDDVDRSRASLDWMDEREEGVDNIGRREASLVTSAMSGLAILDRCMVT